MLYTEQILESIKIFPWGLFWARQAELCIDDSHCISKEKPALSSELMARQLSNSWSEANHMHVGTVLICNVRGREKHMTLKETL